MDTSYINELFDAAETLRFIQDAEKAMTDHPARRDGHFTATGYILGLVADRLESIGQGMDDRAWGVKPQDIKEAEQ